MKKENNKIFFAIIIGSLIIASSIFLVYSNSSDAILTKKCKQFVSTLANKNPATEAYAFSKCVKGEF